MAKRSTKKKARGRKKPGRSTKAVKDRKGPAANGDRHGPAPTIVGIGASAGGLAALEEFFHATPAETGSAFVVVMHLDAKQKSVLAELLQRCTGMPVLALNKKTRAHPDHVYVVPPGKLVTIMDGVLHPASLEESLSPRLPIDTFFRSLAADQGENAVCVVLSGTGSDGTLGLRAVKAEHGMVMVQDKSAKYGGMPHSAIETGLADFVLPPREMPACLKRYIKHASVLIRVPPVRIDAERIEVLQEILNVLRARTGHDFSQYKTNTLLRRIQRRMSLHQIDYLVDYQRLIKDNREESWQLFRELLIGVTGFFRDPEAFDALKAAAEQRFAEREPGHQPIRVWVPGCSTGEEAYSVSMILHECFEASEQPNPLQVFATDIDEDAIEVARAGIYPAGIRSDVSDARLKRFFKLEDDGRFRVRKSIRETLVFATQNVVSDPPFSKLDFISCRNLLIYFSSELQRQILNIFHYSLQPDGLLLLGSSESIGPASKWFKSIDSKWRLFCRLPDILPRPAVPLLPQFGRAKPEVTGKPFVMEAKRKPETYLVHLLQAVLRETNTPPCAVVDDAYNIVFVHGRTGRFLEPAEGAASMSILQMARPGLKEELGTCLRKAVRDHIEVRRQNIAVDNNGGKVRVDLSAKPLTKPKSLAGLTLVVFNDAAEHTANRSTDAGQTTAGSPGSTIEDLRHQLERARENHQTTIEELETANEELQSTNEELQSTNEELQSTNEELGTSKEELQSLNEEATTINAELQGRVEELSRANDDLKNLLDSTEIATIFLDTDLNVRRFTPACSSIIPLAAADLGRPITHFATDLVNVNLGEITSAMLDDLVVRELEVETRKGRVYLLRIRPYRTSQNVIDGAVLTFDDRTATAANQRVMEQKIKDGAIELGKTKTQLEESRAKNKRRVPGKRKK